MIKVVGIIGLIVFLLIMCTIKIMGGYIGGKNEWRGEISARELLSAIKNLEMGGMKKQ